MRTSYTKGFSVIEVLLAAALFLVFALGVVPTLLRGIGMNRLGQEETVATQYASEGMDAVRSIRNRSFQDLVETGGSGLAVTGSGLWGFSGESDMFEDKYVRTVVIEGVQRNSGGDIVDNGGTDDPQTKKVTVTVAWQSLSPEKSVILTTYMTDWKGPVL